jgi:uncharacterized protein YcfJ
MLQPLKILLLSPLLFSPTFLSAQQDVHRAVHAKNIQVTDVKPLENPSVQQRCQPKIQVQLETKRYIATLAGAVIGGIVGNQFGKGKGKTFMTLAGTMVGGIAAYQHNQNNNSQQNQRCQQDSQIKHYLVSYRYQGQRYQTVLNYHPRKSIPISTHHLANKGYF